MSHSGLQVTHRSLISIGCPESPLGPITITGSDCDCKEAVVVPKGTLVWPVWGAETIFATMQARDGSCASLLYQPSSPGAGGDWDPTQYEV